MLYLKVPPPRKLSRPTGEPRSQSIAYIVSSPDPYISRPRSDRTEEDDHMSVRSARNRSQSAAFSPSSPRMFTQPLGETSSVDIRRNLMGKRKEIPDYEAVENMLRHSVENAASYVEGENFEGNGSDDDMNVKSNEGVIAVQKGKGKQKMV